MKLPKILAVAAVAALLPISSLAVTHRVVHNYKVKPEKHPHLTAEKHKTGHGKEFAKATKERIKNGQELHKKSSSEEFGVHKVK
jgi:hypothetical protein